MNKEIPILSLATYQASKSQWPSFPASSNTKSHIRSALRVSVSQIEKQLDNINFLCGSIKTEAKGENFITCLSEYKKLNPCIIL